VFVAVVPEIKVLIMPGTEIVSPVRPICKFPTVFASLTVPVVTAEPAFTEISPETPAEPPVFPVEIVIAPDAPDVEPVPAGVEIVIAPDEPEVPFVVTPDEIVIAPDVPDVPVPVEIVNADDDAARLFAVERVRAEDG
jgi:hypothetical protein